MSTLTPKTKAESRARRHARIRAKVVGTAMRPRLAVFRSNRGIFGQVIDDERGVTLAHGVSGGALAKAALAKGITAVVFDRGGFRYAGKVKLFADEARAAGLTF